MKTHPTFLFPFSLTEPIIIAGPINGDSTGDEEQILFCRWNFQETHFKWFPVCIVETLQPFLGSSVQFPQKLRTVYLHWYRL